MMSFKKFPVDFVFLIPGLVFFIICYIPETGALDIAVHDTYFVISWHHVSFIASLYCAFCFLIYLLLRILKRKRILWLIYFHLLAGIIIPFAFVFWYRISSKTEIERYYDYSVYKDLTATSYFSPVEIIGTIISTLFLLALGVFLTNIFIGIFKRKLK